MHVAVVTGASKGLGRALMERLVSDGWTVVVDARHSDELEHAAAAATGPGRIACVAGDVADPAHRAALAARAAGEGTVELLVNNASALGPSPMPWLEKLDAAAFRDILEVNVVAPLALVQALSPSLAGDAVVINVSSDAGAEAYETWGGYGASKAALDHLTRVLAVEQPARSWYAFDPGDMRTEMHQAAFAGEDISDRPEPATVVPAVLRLLAERPPSGRYTVSQLLAPASVG